MEDPVSPRLREVESEIDSAYKSNPLTALPFGNACWNIMAFYEDLAIRDIVQGRALSVHQIGAEADSMVVDIQFPFRWISDSCPTGSVRPFCYSDVNYDAAFRLSELAHQYRPFNSAFTYASRRHITLALSDSLISVDGRFHTDSRYEAYDRLVPIVPSLPDLTGPDILRVVDHNLVVKHDTFHYQWGRRFVAQAMQFLLPVLERQFQLPAHWEFPRYSIAEFRSIASALITLAFIHSNARILAARQGCIGLGINNAILLVEPDRLCRLLARYSGVDYRRVALFVEDFTYGSRGIRRPDPALQPIVRIDETTLAIMPNLIIASSMERNWITLVNRIAEDRPHYLRLTAEKENAMRDSILSKLSITPIREFHGRLPGAGSLPDIDLAVISPQHKAVIVVELKWFLMPSEVREVIEKSDEIKKGIDQASRLAQAYADTPALFHKALGVDDSYSFSFIVLSDNVVGADWVQNPRIPVLQAKHFCRKANQLGNLRSLAEWIAKRRYLPVEGIHYRVVPVRTTIGSWSLDWYGIKPLISGLFDP